MNIPRNTNASLYNAWFKKEYPDLFECEIEEVVESCEECGFCETKEAGSVIDISANEPHLVCEVIDLKCHHRWIAVYPEKTLLKQLECPNCGAVGFVIKTDQDLEEV